MADGFALALQKGLRAALVANAGVTALPICALVTSRQTLSTPILLSARLLTSRWKRIADLHLAGSKPFRLLKP